MLEEYQRTMRAAMKRGEDGDAEEEEEEEEDIFLDVGFLWGEISLKEEEEEV